ncbi:MAG: septation protein IspZ [Candidatus Paceibacterota bacterium]|jgi:intracellular septation protein
MINFSRFSLVALNRLIIGITLEFGPIFIFLLSFHYLHIYKATFILMIATIISTVATYRIQKRLPYIALYVAFLTLVFGYMTIINHQPKFIQMRDTLYDITSALTLLIGLMVNVSFLKLAFHDVLPMTNQAWNKLTYIWIGFFIIVAVINEYVRRTMTLMQWFDFKSIMVFVTLFFGLLTLYFIYEKSEHHK